MMVSCKQVSCAEDAVQVRLRTHARRCYGPASDAEFLRSIAGKTPGRDDDNDAAQRHQNQQMMRRQVYLKSYVFATKEAEDKAKATRGGLIDAVLPLLIRRRKKTHDDRMAAAVSETCSSKTTSSTSSGTSRWCTKKAGKIMSQLLTRLPSCPCSPAAASSS
ncbi:hypothetical protein BAE44_0005323 [Dichanthelium oligosanthes]|uniref:Uncharacterized protein n=1 Tax=Dichanthelium oligosanthes TaxID=888268 RepID=A0A1E5W8T4_9POAL|nr:hypothetical protein BAE44_0005323 [Dichanthelium oligosanthes]